ncbi:MAG: WYL domain-containing protein [Ilumatobacter sp.]|uniref:helix-turn-helix transcriptional regulator n=1 Tax=Ilumatobacter sp. TaxID=1967498 RepID=UPI00262A7343|nr:WYL domain-containing protein [Ilumatobacter sp.]MDJ0769494.1 WYL domain-containing protein [Ilumatobacter sp.]
MRASRLVELLLRLQLQGGAPASELAAAFEVSVRTVYRDVEALSAAGVPIYTEVGRNGGIRIDPSYRVAGLPRLDTDEARGVLFAVVPAIAAQLGFDAAVADRALLPAMESSAETAARVVRDRLLIEPSHWFLPPDDPPALADIARAVWECREAKLVYRGADVVVLPLGLILKGDTWYLLARARRGVERESRLFRLSRVDAVELLDHRFDRPTDFDLAAAWADRRRAFIESLPEYRVTVRVAPAAEPLLALLDEGAPELPLPPDVERDEHGWARLRLRFERDPEGVARHLRQLGADIEVLDPPELRGRMSDEAARLATLYVDGA